ncbi:MAG: hypothetical protein KDI41_22185 [Pseudomonadales bacterium]|nr:hypothetical protein [Pseudomonadales bacterium]
MTRVLYWNIEKFATNKIANPGNGRQNGAALNQNQASVQRLAYINAHFGITGALGAASPPDIFVVVEVATGYDGRGIIARGSGPAGALTLLAALQATTGNPNWRLVPPLQTGPRESVAVYYDSTNYVFTGPWQWPGGVGPAFDPAGMGPPPVAAYPAPFVAPIVANAVVAAGAAHNVGIAQSRLAAATGFTYAAALAPALAGPINFGGVRAPYWVSFAELGVGPAPRPVARNISLFCIHSPANAGAGVYLRRLDRIAEIADGPLAGNEVRVVLGDFNVNLLNNDPLLTRNGNYATLAGNGYALGIDRPGGPPAPLNGWPGYFATHIRRTSHASYWSRNAQLEYYPGYGYTGTHVIANFYSIDNILARYGGAAGGPMANVTVLNGIVGSNYGAIAPPPGAAPIGTYNLPIRMGNLVQFGAPPPAQAPVHNVGRQGAFRGWGNYGCIRSTSDHLAIVADI